MVQTIDDTEKVDDASTEKFFSKKDLVPMLAGTIDMIIFGIGVIVTIFWLGSIHHQPLPTSSKWVPSSHAAAALALQTAQQSTPTTANVPTQVTTYVCSILVPQTLNSGQVHYVEYRGSCNTIHAIAAQHKSGVRWLPVQKFVHTQSGS